MNRSKEKETWYFKNFRCKCGSCRLCCCDRWRIPLTQEKYYELVGIGCGEELRHRLDCAFAAPEEPSPESYRYLKMNWLGECELRDGDGLCMLQKECGEKRLPEVCRLFPRSIRRTAAGQFSCCSGACEAVLDFLLSGEEFHLTVSESDTEAVLDGETGEDPGLIEDIWTILFLRSVPLKERLRRLFERTGAPEIPEERAGEICRELAGEEEPLEEFFRFVLKHSSGTILPYSGCERENLILNHLMFMNYPYTDGRLTPDMSGPGLQVLIHLIRCTEVLRGAERKDALVLLFRFAEHSPFYYNVRVLWGRKP